MFKTSTHKKSIPFQTSQEAIESHPVQNDDMEIVVVSDTVRQRRSRTPSTSATSTANTNDDTKEIVQSFKANDSSGNVMPDLLPKTFHLVESSTLFSQIQDSGADLLMSNPDDVDREHKFAVVEIRESNITMPKRAIGKIEPNVSENSIAVSNTCSILESVNFMKPSSVETVHIVDATSEPSDTETSTTPNPDDGTESVGSSSDSDSENEYDTGETYIPQGYLPDKPKRQVWLSRIEERPSSKVHRSRLQTTTKEALLIDRDSFIDGDDNELNDEPLIFSDDDDQNIEVAQSDELTDRDTVYYIKPPHLVLRQNDFSSSRLLFMR